jgi:hypothetical protein
MSSRPSIIDLPSLLALINLIMTPTALVPLDNTLGTTYKASSLINVVTPTLFYILTLTNTPMTSVLKICLITRFLAQMLFQTQY